MGYPECRNWRDLVTDDCILYLDLDQSCYVSAAGAEKKSIIATHKKSGRQKEFAKITDFWGRQKNVVGGWLKDQNTNMEADAISKGRVFKPFTRDDFEITPKQVAEPVENCLHTLKMKINALISHLDNMAAVGVLGGDNNFRLSLPTPEIYKGNREDNLRPLLLKDARDYVQKKYGAIVVDGIEADDYLSFMQQEGHDHYEKYGKFNKIIASFDKDQVQVPGLLFNSQREKDPKTKKSNWKYPIPWLIDNSMGEIWMQEGEVKGWGKKFFGYQMLCGDPTDHVLPYQPFGIRFGAASCFKIIAPCTTEKEMWQVIIDQYKKWFPDGVAFKDHMGNDRNFTAGQWASVIFQCVYMKRHANDNTTLMTVLRNVGAI